MSVVNKMLQDLEARQADPATINADYQAPLKNNKQVWYVLLLLIALGLLAFWLFSSDLTPWAKSENESAPAVVVNSVQTQKTTPKTMLVAPSPESEVAAVGITAPDVSSAQETTTTQILATDVSATEPEALLIAELDGVNQSGPATAETPTQQLPNADVQTGSFQMQDSSQANQKTSLKLQIKDALADHNSALAIALLGQLLEQEPDNSETIKKLATLLYANGNVLKSTLLLQSSVQRAPLRGDFRLMLARLYVQQNRNDDALAVLQKIQPAQYMEIDYLAYRAHVAQQVADYEMAKQDYTLLTQVDNNNARWWLGLAITQEKLGASKTALSSYYEAQNLAQLDPAVTEFIKQRISMLVGAP